MNLQDMNVCFEEKMRGHIPRQNQSTVYGNLRKSSEVFALVVLITQVDIYTHSTLRVVVKKSMAFPATWLDLHTHKSPDYILNIYYAPSLTHVCNVNALGTTYR